MKRIVSALVITVLLAGWAVFQTGDGGTQARQAALISSEIALGKTAPAFSLLGLDEKEYKVGGVRDKPLVLNFWASWCGPCHQEAPDLKQMYDKYGEQVDLYGVNVTKGDRLPDVKRFVKQHKLPFPILLDEKGTAAEMYRIIVVPTTFLIDKQGNLRDVIHVLPPDELDKRIRALIDTSK
ncbi:TlpA family protein disulfide reductase [Paenibacillus xerothermodurans]|uniref:TlpA family protein disulfide reductase n=1 Tax=Paenibacillus xerothermodurans TaxID=1977292 RepID=A0A2W1NPW7_PAEXE|nr:TlpA disulfide reductase family protein [Paenibacillus xerothermodurans]PZE20953.1 TlpA family protein disulfide reductase [Paenibacillus xerothermodurans]